MTEKDFKATLDALWSCYAASNRILDLLESIGLSVNGNAHPGKDAGMHDLYVAPSATAKALLAMVHADPAGKAYAEALEELDSLFSDAYTEDPAGTSFPEQHYEKLLSVLAVYGTAPLPWQNKGPCPLTIKGLVQNPGFDVNANVDAYTGDGTWHDGMYLSGRYSCGTPDPGMEQLMDHSITYMTTDKKGTIIVECGGIGMTAGSDAPKIPAATEAGDGWKGGSHG